MGPLWGAERISCARVPACRRDLCCGAVVENAYVVVLTGVQRRGAEAKGICLYGLSKGQVVQSAGACKKPGREPP